MNRKQKLTVILFLLISTIARAQITYPVKWSYAFKKISTTEAVIFMKATIDDGWHIYSQKMKDGGPTKTSFTFSPSKNYALIGKTIEPKPVTYFEKLFNMDVGYFEHSVIFQQRIKFKVLPTLVKGTVEYMTCTNKQCHPADDLEFSVIIK